MGSKALETFFRSIMYKTNSNGQKIDPWDTPHIISRNDVLSLLLITAYCFRLLR